jgi:hypothetical protein
MRQHVSLFAVALMLIGCAAVLATEKNVWWSAGPVYRGDVELSVSGSSYVQQNKLHAASGAYQAPSGAGSASSYADRTYDDGFVAVDPGTIESGDGLTWYWGYSQAGQYNAAADTLTFTRGGGRRVSVSTAVNAEWDDSDRMETWGVEFTAGGYLGEAGRATLGWQAGLGLLWNLDSRFSANTYSENISEQQFSIVDVYQLDGVVPPAAPYVGTYDGPGPLIPNRPSARQETVTGGTSWRAENEVRLDLDAAVQQLWVGPRLEAQAGKGVAVFCVPFVSLNRLEARYERDEWFYAVRGGQRTTIASWNNRVTDEQMLLGVGVRAGARVALSGAWFLDVGAGIESIESAETTIGPNTATLDLSGYSVVAQIGAAF